MNESLGQRLVVLLSTWIKKRPSHIRGLHISLQCIHCYKAEVLYNLDQVLATVSMDR